MPKNEYFQNSIELVLVSFGELNRFFLSEEEIEDFSYKGESWPRVEILEEIGKDEIQETMPIIVKDIYTKIFNEKISNNSLNKIEDNKNQDIIFVESKINDYISTNRKKT